MLLVSIKTDWISRCKTARYQVYHCIPWKWKFSFRCCWTIVGLLKCGQVVGTKSRFYPHPINILSTSCPQDTQPHKLSTSKPLSINFQPKIYPFPNKLSFFSPLQNQHSINRSTLCRHFIFCNIAVYQENIEVGNMLIKLWILCCEYVEKKLRKYG